MAAGGDLTADERELVAAALAARAHAYAPYSRFHVGAALRGDDGSVVTGANVENAAYPATICAERVAVGYAVAHGLRVFRQLAVAGTGSAVCTPCGTCRQVLNEFAPDLEVLAVGGGGAVARYLLGRDLLPDGFGPASLDSDQPPGATEDAG
ncbi:MAG: cytidine deaminase [Actinobacteria bacterium]|nr:cytidine deaminase [Actinomycetota bacterium]